MSDCPADPFLENAACPPLAAAAMTLQALRDLADDDLAGFARAMQTVPDENLALLVIAACAPGNNTDNKESMARRKTPPSPPTTCVCWQAFSSALLPGSGVVHTGDRYPQDHPLVVAHGDYFLPADTPPDELTAHYQRHMAVARGDT